MAVNRYGALPRNGFDEVRSHESILCFISIIVHCFNLNGVNIRMDTGLSDYAYANPTYNFKLSDYAYANPTYNFK